MFCRIRVNGIFWKKNKSLIFIPHHTIVAGYYGFTLDVCVSVRPSVVRPSVRFSFPDDNLSKHQWIFTKLSICMCIDIVEIWFGILPMGKFRHFFTELSARDTIMAGYYSLTFLLALKCIKTLYIYIYIRDIYIYCSFCSLDFAQDQFAEGAGNSVTMTNLQSTIPCEVFKEDTTHNQVVCYTKRYVFVFTPRKLGDRPEQMVWPKIRRRKRRRLIRVYTVCHSSSSF